MPVDTYATAHPSSTGPLRRRSYPRRLAWLLLPVCLGFAGMSAALVALRQAPLPKGTFARPNTLVAANGQVLADWSPSGPAPREVPLTDIPRSLREATLAVEDANFYHHHALSLSGLARALWVDVRHGHVVQGGSTITQQLAKNLFLSQDRTLGRKLREMLYAIQLELHASKSDILEKYLNVIYYGHGAYGAEAASELYFGKPVQQLSLAEAALLAGLPKGPELYSPYRSFAAAKARQHQVLDRMVAAGYLTPAQAAEAYRQPLAIQKQPQQTRPAPYATQVALDEARRRFHLTDTALEQGGVRITTTVDPLLQKAAERAVATTLPPHSGLQAALVALDPKTGAILALVGGRDYRQSPYNRAFAERQPGSTFKAVLYAAALERGWSPAREVNSEETTFLYSDTDNEEAGADKRYTVHDFGNLYAHRPLTLREALARSDNVYAVTTNLELGPQAVIRTARQMGIQSPLMPYPSLALGVFPTSPLEMATAYATLANGGLRVHAHAVARVSTAAQDTTRAMGAVNTDTAAGAGATLRDPVGEAPEAGRERVLSAGTSFILTDLLTSVLKPGGTAYPVTRYLHGPAAAKTGTTDTDAWMVGYTPHVVCAVWVGYDNNRPLTRSESHLAAPIWAKFMGVAQQRLPGPWYTPPAGLVRATIDVSSGLLATPQCRATETDYFLPGTEPTAFCPLHPAALPPIPTPTRPWWHRLWG
ncbi:transglycosylase domain-containing protein [Alicyclobacillus herbarius]|uniref:transglycosylase domain-containing protein n=1 Tax=Alicyclobacillus herbarius TaxID=122960 RepID=UPI000402DF38|nr:PBP1A family penicillin-binding protein [Alicyclobacillus herbarius]